MDEISLPTKLRTYSNVSFNLISKFNVFLMYCRRIHLFYYIFFMFEEFHLSVIHSIFSL